MPSSYASLFDDLLASNKQQMDEIMGGTASSPTAHAPSAVAAKDDGAARTTTETTATNSRQPETLSGTANGVPFRITV